MPGYRHTRDGRYRGERLWVGMYEVTVDSGSISTHPVELMYSWRVFHVDVLCTCFALDVLPANRAGGQQVIGVASY